MRDLFLQVFDDGRLTDLQGRDVDFRRSVIVLTSNIGSPLAEVPPRRLRAGGRHVLSRRNRASRAHVVQARAGEPLRPSRGLPSVRTGRDARAPRQGARRRACAPWPARPPMGRRGGRVRVHFLIDKGFSPELGARPLKRAVEQYLLAPLARAIVEQSVPDGDQFLFVDGAGGRADRRCLRRPRRRAGARRRWGAAGLDLASLARAPEGDERLGPGRARRARSYLAVHRRGGADPEGSRALDGVRAGFWNATTASTCSPRRSTSSACSGDSYGRAPGARLQRSAKADGRANPQSRRPARRTPLRPGPSARRGRERLLHRVRGLAKAVRGRSRRPRVGDEFAAVLTEMYVAWADRRGMSAELLERPTDDAVWRSRASAAARSSAWRRVCTSSSTWARPRRRPGRGQDQVQVVVAPRPPGRRVRRPGDEALALLKTAAAPNVVVRRYRPGKSPLVRDSVRGYRTGRLDLVLRRRLRPFYGQPG